MKFFRNFLLFFKSELLFAKNNLFKLFAFCLAVGTLIFVFSPILKSNFDNYTWEQNLIQNSGRFDYRLELPNQKKWPEILAEQTKKHANMRESTEHFFKPSAVYAEANNWESAFSYSATEIAIKEGFFYKIWSVPDTDQQINKVVDLLGSTPSQNLGPTLKNGKAIVSRSFLEANPDYIETKTISVFETSLQIVQAGESLHSHSFESEDLGNMILSSTFKKSPYEKGAFIHVSEGQFEQWQSEKKFFNNKNYIYLRARSGLEQPANIDLLKEELEAYYKQPVKVVAFENEISSGFKMKLTQINLIVTITTFTIASLLIIFIFVFFNQSEISRRKNIYYNLFSNGVTTQKICFLQALRNLFFFAVFFTSTYYLGVIVGYRWVMEQWLNSANVAISPDFFSPLALLMTAVIAPLVSATIIYFFVLHYARKEISKTPSRRVSSTSVASRSKIVSLLFFNSLANRFRITKKHMIMFWSFKRSPKQVFFFVLEITILLVIFFAAFAKTSFDNFVGSSTKFLAPQAQSMTEITDSLYLTDDNQKIANRLNFVDSVETKQYEVIANQNDLMAKVVSGLLTSSSTGGQARRFKITQDTDIKSIKEYMREFAVEEVFFGVVPYDTEQDLPVLALTFEYEKRIQSPALPIRSRQPDLGPELISSQMIIGEELVTDPSKSRAFLAVENNILRHLQNEERNFVAQKNDIYVTEQFVNSLGYRLGDSIDGHLKLDNKQIDQTDEFRIVGIINARISPVPMIFANYEYIEKYFFENNKEHYNAIISRSPRKHFNRFMVIDWQKTTEQMRNLSLQSFSSDENIASKIVRFLAVANGKSLFLESANDIFVFHFGSYQKSFTYLIILLTFILVVSMFIASFFLFESESGPFQNLRVLGYHRWNLIQTTVIFGFIRLVYAVIIALTISFGSFLLVNYWVQNFSLITLNWDNVGTILLYVIIGYIIFISSILFIQWNELKKQHLFSYKWENKN